LPERPAAAGGPKVRRPSSPTLLVCLVLAALTNLPYLHAVLEAPPGHRFVGFFYYIDDAYNYLSYAQQAEDGAFVFRNKMVPEDHAPALVNLEWWTVGRLSALFGRRPALAYRVFGVLVATALVVVVGRLLARRGIGGSRRGAALLLVFTAAGVGGLLLRLGVPGQRCLDLTTGLFPFIEALANPHFTTGTLLLLLALLSFAENRPAAGVVWGSLLGLVRPYDLALLVAARGAGIAVTERPAAWPRALLPLAGLLPALAYNYWLFLRDARFATYSSAQYVMPPLVDFLAALAPAAFLAAIFWRPDPPGASTRSAGLHLAAWAAVGGLVAAVRPVPFPLQFLAGLGLPLLTLAAIGLARHREAATWTAVAGLGSTAITALMLVWAPNPRWHVPAGRLDAALLLRPACGPHDLALTPPDIGLYTAGLTACRVYVGHAAARGYAERELQARTFYGPAEPAWRALLLDRAAITRLMLPGDPGPVPVRWLGDGTPFRRVGRVGQGPAAISVYAREGAVPSPR
jgi:hypothetical protein